MNELFFCFLLLLFIVILLIIVIHRSQFLDEYQSNMTKWKIGHPHRYCKLRKQVTRMLNMVLKDAATIFFLPLFGPRPKRCCFRLWYDTYVLSQA